VHTSPAAAATAILAAADALRDDVATPEAHAQALFLASLLLEDLPRSAVTPATTEALMVGRCRLT
jgi:condensin complex subunit 3